MLISKERWIAFSLAILCVPIFAIPVYCRWIESLSDLVTQIVAGLLLLMGSASVALWYHGKPKTKNTENAREDLRVHYQRMIQRMEQWSYLHSEYGDEMICLATKNAMFAPRRSGTPPNLEKDKMHLKKFEKTHNLYLEGKNLSKDYKMKQAETTRLLKRLFDGKGVTDEIERAKLRFSLRHMIELELRGFQPGALADDPPNLVKIRNELKQRQDLRKSIYDELVVQGKIKDNEREFLKSLREEVIERSKESNYSLPLLSNGECDDCKHLKATLA